MMNKHFINNSKVELIYSDKSKDNPRSHLYDNVVIGETPGRPETEQGETSQLYYEDGEFFWEIEDNENI